MAEPLHILLVEDDKDANQFFCLALESEGFTVVPTFNGAQALDALEKETFGLVLLDIMMEGLDGIETCQEIRKSYTADQLPICMITASMDADRVVKSFQVGANGYIVKPFDLDELLNKIRELTT